MNPDYFVSTYNNIYGYHPHIQSLLSYSDDPIVPDQEIIDKFSGLNVKLIRVDDINSARNFFIEESKQFHGLMQGLESSFLQYWKFKEGLNLINNYETRENFKYDIIIKTRCDIIHNPIQEINFDDLESFVIVSTGNVFPNDCIIIAKRDAMFQIIDIMVSEFYNYENLVSNIDPPHGLLKGAIGKTGKDIKTHPIMKYVQRVNRIQEY
jgi:uncharacterized protein (UPF0248 family)